MISFHDFETIKKFESPFALIWKIKANLKFEFDDNIHYYID